MKLIFVVGTFLLCAVTLPSWRMNSAATQEQHASAIKLVPSENTMTPPKPPEDSRILGVTKILSESRASWSPHEAFAIAEHIVQEADGIGIAPSLLLAVIEVESSFNPCAISPVGAKGLMQVMPARIMGPKSANENFAFNHHLVFDPHWNISFGTAYLSELMTRFGSLEMALAAYNRGPTRLSRQLRQKTFRGCSYTRKVFARQEAIREHTI